MTRSVDRRDLERRYRIHPAADCFSDAMIDVTFVDEVPCQFVIGRKRTVGCIVGIDQGRQRRQVPLGATFAQKQVQAKPEFLLGFS